MKQIQKYDYLVVFLIAMLFATSFIGFYPIYILDESRNAEAAREMLANNDFITPYFNGQLRTDKPPLHYYFMILGYKIFGINALGARFFSGVFGALTLLITFIFSKRHLNSRVAWASFFILISSIFFIQEFHLSVPDPYLIFFISTSLFLFYEFHAKRKLLVLIFAYTSIGLGVLTKGPIALLIPTLILFFFLIASRSFSFKSIMAYRPFMGLVLVFAIAFPWYFLVHNATNGTWTEGFFLDHNISRFNSGKEGHGGIFLITPAFVILGLLPFSVFLFQSFIKGFAKRKKNPLLLFCFVAGLVTIIFFSLSSTKLPNYPMPCYPFISVLLGSYLINDIKLEKRVYTLISLIFLGLISLALPIGGYLALGVENELSSFKNYALFLFLIPASYILALYFYKRHEYYRTFITISIGWIVSGAVIFGVIYPKLNEANPVEKTLAALPSKTEFIVYKRFDSAFPFNYKREFKIVKNTSELAEYINKNPDVFILTNTRKQSDLDSLNKYKLILEQKALFENHTTRVFTNKNIQ